MFEECWPYAHSFYAITKTHPTMAVSPRILQAGNCAEHNSLKMAFEESVLQIDTQAWTDSLAEGAGVSSFLGFIFFIILSGIPKKELLWSLWIVSAVGLVAPKPFLGVLSFKESVNNIGA